MKSKRAIMSGHVWIKLITCTCYIVHRGGARDWLGPGLTS
uniref:Uncharacterized protein n=1 Tax=Arundo donax TaxID=35708 RepID=A0A0A9FEH4_ARUDO